MLSRPSWLPLAMNEVVAVVGAGMSVMGGGGGGVKMGRGEGGDQRGRGYTLASRGGKSDD